MIQESPFTIYGTSLWNEMIEFRNGNSFALEQAIEKILDERLRVGELRGAVLVNLMGKVPEIFHLAENFLRCKEKYHPTKHLDAHGICMAAAINRDIPYEKCMNEASISGLPLHHITFQGADFSWVILQKCKVSHCDMSKIYMSEGQIEDTAFESVDMSNSVFNDVWGINYCVFTEVNLSRSYFRSCKFYDVDFRGANLNQSVFLDCDLSSCHFNDAQLCSIILAGDSKPPQ